MSRTTQERPLAGRVALVQIALDNWRPERRSLRDYKVVLLRAKSNLVQSDPLLRG